MPGIKTTHDMDTLDFIARFAERTGLTDSLLNTKDDTIKQLRVIISICIQSGYIDSNPFSHYGYSLALKWYQKAPSPKRSKPRRNANPIKVHPARTIASSQALDLAKSSAPDEQPQKPDPWEDWDATQCPGHVREDGHLVVFGRDKGRIKTKSARALFEALEKKYPEGFDLPGLAKAQIVGDPRGILVRYREKDHDCLSAIQLPGVKKGGLYRFGRPE
jgi:hypothetical protein